MENDTTPDAEVIDLVRLAEPARQLVAIYDSIGQGTRPAPGRLDQVLRRLSAMPRPPGQLGADIELLASGGDGDRARVVDAIERLRRISQLRPRPAVKARRARLPTGPSTSDQLQLPGITTERTIP
ncbi:MAG: hypothetical protein R2770_00750 [Acidimicrobiales bacterium]